MLAYYPALDPYHTSFRMLRLLTESPYAIEEDRLRLLDFYLLFSSLLRKISLPQGLVRSRNRVAQPENRYRFAGQPQLAFRTLTPVHDAAIGLLSTSSWVTRERDRLTVNAPVLPEGLLSVLRARNDIEKDLIDFLVMDLHTVPMLGPEGLKRRSGLMEYRYDAV